MYPPTDARKLFAKNVRRHLKRCGFSTAKFAQFIDVDRTTVYQWLRAKASPEVKNIGHVADALGVSVAALFSER